jgi:uncharacterized alpha-E superfamily protein
MGFTAASSTGLSSWGAVLETAEGSAGAAASFSDFSWEGLVTFWKKLPKIEARLALGAGLSAFFSSLVSSFLSSAGAATAAR